jgi:hypothetical protein
VFGPITRSYAPSRNFSEGTLFFGYTTIALAIVGVVLLIRKAPETVRSTTRHRGLIFAAILVPVAYWSSLKSVVHPFGIPVAALSWFLTHVTSFFRVYARFGVLVGLGLIVLAAPALERIMRRARHGTLIVAALLAVVAFELVPGPIVGWAATNPPVYDRWLKTQPLGIVAHYPALTDQEPAIHLGEREIYYQMFAKKPLYNIFGPGTGNTRESAIRILSRYITDPLTPSILAAEHVRYVVLHDDVYRSQHETPPQAPPQLKLVKRFPDVRVYTLRPGVAAADLDPLLEQNAAAIGLVEGLAFDSVDLGGGFSGTFTYDKEDGWRRLHGAGTITLQNTNVNLKRVQIVVRAVSPGVPRTVELLGSDGTVIARNTIATQATQVTFGPFPVALGTTRLSLRTQQRTPKGADLLVAPLLIQPLADFSNSLRAS